MVNKELIDWVNNAKEKGFDDSQIKYYLNRCGYDKGTIDECFSGDSILDHISDELIFLIIFNIIIFFFALGIPDGKISETLNKLGMPLLLLPSFITMIITCYKLSRANSQYKHCLYSNLIISITSSLLYLLIHDNNEVIMTLIFIGLGIAVSPTYFIFKRPGEKKNLPLIINQPLIERKSMKDFLRPDGIKIIISSVFLILMLIPFLMNIMVAEDITSVNSKLIETLSERGKSMNKIIEEINEKNPDKTKITELGEKYENTTQIPFEEEEPEAHLKRTFFMKTANEIYEFPLIRAYPYTPVPCTRNFIEDKDKCKNYGTKENYNRLKRTSSYEKSYDKVSVAGYMIHCLAIVLIAYLGSSILYILNHNIRKTKKRNRLLIAAIGFISSIILLPEGKLDSVLLVSAMIIFIVFFLDKEPSSNKNIIYQIIGIVTIMAIIIPFLINSGEDSNNILEDIGFRKTELNMIDCQNTKNLTKEEKEGINVPEELMGEDWNVCYEPGCNKICEDHCWDKDWNIERSMYLRGNDPGCLCQCGKSHTYQE
ncbi:MAG: hypothetical protein ACQEP1_01750 [Nanobdellota archaeon]